jgi:dephospho-CoA kinase
VAPLSPAPDRPAVIAVTGDVCAGKSTFAEIFAATGGARYLSADDVAHEVLDEEEIARELGERFGAAVRDPAGGIDRRALAGAAFGSEEDLKRLTEVVYPRIRQRLAEKLARLAEASDAPVVLEAPTLYEAGAEGLADAVITVEAPRRLRAERCGERGWDAGELARRERFLIGPDARRERADVVVENQSDDPKSLRQAANDAWHTLSA